MNKLTREEAVECAWKADWWQRMKALRYLTTCISDNELETLWGYKYASERADWTEATDKAIRQGIMRASWKVGDKGITLNCELED